MARATRTQMSEFFCVDAFVRVRVSSIPFACKMEAGDVSFKPDGISLLLLETCWAQRLHLPLVGKLLNPGPAAPGGRAAQLAPCPGCGQWGRQRTPQQPLAAVTATNYQN